MQLIAGIIAIISVLNLERRAQFFLTSVYIFLAYSGIYIGLNLIQEGGLKSVQTNDIALFAGSATLTLFSYPLIYVLERIFGFYTDVSLMELSNTRNKLLRELAIKAPGTFQHSMLVANIAEEGIYNIDRIKEFTSNYQKSGGKESFANYYTAGYNAVIMDKSLRNKIVFAQHNLATDYEFGEMNLIMCRNVLIYFENDLKNRVFKIFNNSLIRRGFLCLGSKENIAFTEYGKDFDKFDKNEKIYQKKIS